MNLSAETTAWRQDRASWEQRGVYLPSVISYMPPEMKQDYGLAMDAVPLLGTTDPNAGIPWALTNLIDPEVFRVLYTPMAATEIMPEVRKGDWLTDTAMFPVIEATGEVASYGDYNDGGGRAGVNTNFPQRQAYNYQIIKQYGVREAERAGLARINYISEIDKAAALSLNKFQNFAYFFGIAGLQNYGILNDPNLTAPITPAVKAYGGTRWIVNGQIQCTANEVYNDVQSLYYQLVTQTRGLVPRDAAMLLALAPEVDVAFTAANTFNVHVDDLIGKSFPKLKRVTATQYGAISTFNPTQGIAAGNMMQMIVPEIEGQRTGVCAYNEKMRAFPIITEMSAFKQKMTSGVWGAVIRMTAGIASMVGL